MESDLSATRLTKIPSGIKGLDEITFGGLPQGRTILVTGNPGCGKTLLALEFLVRGIREFDEPGVFVSFEETKEELVANVASLGWDLNRLIEDKKLYIDHVAVERNEIEETGEYDLEGLFIRLGYAVESVGAKRIALDTIESLFASLPNEFVLRAELRRLFRWLKDKGLTAPHHRRSRRRDADPARAGRIRLGLRHPVEARGQRGDFHAAPADAQIPGLPPRHQRVTPSSSRIPASPSFPSPPWGWITRLPRTASRRACRNLTKCSAGRDITREPASSYPVRPGRVKAPSPRNSLIRYAPGADDACISPSKNRLPRSSGTCPPSASTCESTWTATAFPFSRNGPRFTAWKCIC